MNGLFVGNAFASRWVCGDDATQMCWVTQLVVHKDYRKRGLATGLLEKLRDDGDGVVGIVSSHPAACLAAVRGFTGKLLVLECVCVCVWIASCLGRRC